MPIHTDIFISRYISSIFIFQKIAIINTVYFNKATSAIIMACICQQFILEKMVSMVII